MKDPYLVLGISKNANQNEIKKAYHNKAKIYHPDLNPKNKNAEAKFKDISLAYELIGDEKERAKYDNGEIKQQLKKDQKNTQERERARASMRTSKGNKGQTPFYHETQQKGGRYSYSFGEDIDGEDFFRNLFHSTNKNNYENHNKNNSQNYSKNDEFYQMEIDFKDAVLGAEREITFANGKRLQVKIPAGIEEGTRLRFKNQGKKENEDEEQGAAYVDIKIKSDERFKRVGSTIESKTEISFMEALLGAEIKIPTIDGYVMLIIPAGTNTDSRLRIRGKGVVFTEGGGRGDQIVLIKVVLPKKINPKLQQAIREWEGKYSYNPREE